MLVIPAIDLLGGNPVRLVQGRYDRVLTTESHPLELARAHASHGATWLHLIDLDGAREGHWCNLGEIAEIAAEVGLPVQAGGGARDRDAIWQALHAGVERVIISTAILNDMTGLDTLTAEFGDRLVVGLDSRRGRLLSRGWTQETNVGLMEAAEEAIQRGASRLIYTDTEQDGMLSGGDPKGVRELVRLGAPVMVAGGISSVRDLKALREAGAEAAVVGRALFDGSLSLEDATALA